VTDSTSHEPLATGLYEHLLSTALQARVNSLPDGLAATCKKLDEGDSHHAIAQYFEHVVVAALAKIRGSDALEKQRRIVDQVTETLIQALGDDWADHLTLAQPMERLLAVHAADTSDGPIRPDTPLARSMLFTGSPKDPTLASQLCKEFATADRVDILCSFIKWSGLRLLMDALRTLTARPGGYGPRLRVVTTSYMGATDPKAIAAIAALPNTEVKVSYDSNHTRLHAKAYLIHRSSAFGSAYIGSANISRAALSEGLEWTTKVSQYELPHLWQRIDSTFESHWNSSEFEAYSDESYQRLREAIEHERQPSTSTGIPVPSFDFRPYPFQEEILDAIASDREVRGKSTHLIVAATGTGKTMVAAFDYRRWSKERKPRLLFIAHREEILKQALGTFRSVLRDQNFGDLLTGNHDPTQRDHLFCTIQSYVSQKLGDLPADFYDYVIVDEFHHAAASSYQHLLSHVQPKVLLGLTATPERADGLDIMSYFGGQSTAEVRLPDAINRRLLVPFQYFGLTDCVDLSGARWQRGGYLVEDLEAVYTGNTVRAQLVFDKVTDILVDPLEARGLGFCVSVAHADFMAEYFTRHGIPSISLTARSSPEERRSARRRLVSRTINFIFAVDLYNEGVDIPEIDTVLFLRPTESLTVYLQQLGRGLRIHEDKECLTVLDFIGEHRREFRFAPRLRALSTMPSQPLVDEMDAGFPHLPSGCFLLFERVAQERVLANVQQAISLYRPRLVQEMKAMGSALGRSPTIQEALVYFDTELEEILRRGLWSRLLSDASLAPEPEAPDEDVLKKGVLRVSHTNDPNQIRFLLDYLEGKAPSDPLADARRSILYVSIWGQGGSSMTLNEAHDRLWQNSSVREDLCRILRHRLSTCHLRITQFIPDLSGPLALHAEYTRDEALIGLGRWNLGYRPRLSEGVLHLPGRQIDAFFVTLQKTESAYSPTTMYEDYVISEDLFHWQSQSTTSADSKTGQRYIHHRRMGYTPLLFVRETKEGRGGVVAPYVFLGPADYVSHHGSKPISITWRLRHSMPAKFVKLAAVG